MTPRLLLNMLLLAVLLAMALLVAGMRRDRTQPNFSFMREMVDSIAYDAFAPNPVYADGRTLQAPVPGTIARGALPLHFAPTPEDAIRAGAELVNPYTQLPPGVETDALLRQATEEGGASFRINCLPCHGFSGAGDGPVVQRGYPPPPPFFVEPLVNMPDGQMFHVMTYGKGNMPPHAGQVSPEERWKIVLYIRSLQQAAATASAAVPAPAAPDSPEAPAEGTQP